MVTFTFLKRAPWDIKSIASLTIPSNNDSDWAFLMKGVSKSWEAVILSSGFLTRQSAMKLLNSSENLSGCSNFGGGRDGITKIAFLDKFRIIIIIEIEKGWQLVK